MVKQMGLLDRLLGRAVEPPSVALDRTDIADAAMYAYRCTDFSDYLKQRREIVEQAKARLIEKYLDAERCARRVCEEYAEDLAVRERRLTDAEDAFVSRRKIVIAALRDSNNSALADVIASETMLSEAR